MKDQNPPYSIPTGVLEVFEWLKNLWQRWFGTEPEIPLGKPEPSAPPKWNGGFAPKADINASLRNLSTPRHRIEPKPEDDWAELPAEKFAEAFSNEIAGEKKPEKKDE